MTDLADLERRIAAVQDQHTQRLDRIEIRLGKVETELSSFRRDLPYIVTEAVREGMKER